MQTLKLGSRGADVMALQRKLNLQPDGVFGQLTLEAVKAFQQAHALSPDGIVGPKTLSALGGLPSSGSSRAIDKIIVHCTATPEGQEVSVSTIRKWHIARKFTDIGYHYVVYLDGSVHAGRPESVMGAHCTGHNSHSIGVCYVGGYAKDGKTIKDTRTPAQKSAMLNLLKALKTKYPKARIHSHKDFANKACPCFDATKEYAGV